MLAMASSLPCLTSTFRYLQALQVARYNNLSDVANPSSPSSSWSSAAWGLAHPAHQFVRSRRKTASPASTYRPSQPSAAGNLVPFPVGLVLSAAYITDPTGHGPWCSAKSVVL